MDRSLAQSWFGPVYVAARNAADPHPNPSRTSRGPKKFRDATRYYRKLARRVEEFSIDDDWYDFHHMHLDYKGHGDRSWKERQRHLIALFALLRRLVEKGQSRPAPIQFWVQIYPLGSWEDSIWMNTAHPGPNPFPYRFESVQWNQPIPERLDEFFADRLLQFGRCDHPRTIFYARAKDSV